MIGVGRGWMKYLKGEAVITGFGGWGRGENIRRRGGGDVKHTNTDTETHVYV